MQTSTKSTLYPVDNSVYGCLHEDPEDNRDDHMREGDISCLPQREDTQEGFTEGGLV